MILKGRSVKINDKSKSKTKTSEQTKKSFLYADFKTIWTHPRFGQKGCNLKSKMSDIGIFT